MDRELGRCFLHGWAADYGYVEGQRAFSVLDVGDSTGGKCRFLGVGGMVGVFSGDVV